MFGPALSDQFATAYAVLQLVPYAFGIVAVIWVLLSVRSAARATR